MLDNTKFLTKDLQIINRALLHPDFIECNPKTNNYRSLRHKDFGVKFSLNFRKAMENGKVIGYCHLEINISPHYHYNQYKHNGNDFTPENCIKTVSGILTYLGIKPNEYNELNVCNIEFGLNLIPETDIKNLITGILFYSRKPFKVGAFPYFKKTDTTSYKHIKAYAKGIQCHESLNAPEIDINTFRFEVKTKQSKNIRKYGINTANDLLNPETYNRLSQELINEWEQILLINLETDLKDLKSDEVQFITNAKKVDFWSDMFEKKYRNKFPRYREKYYNLLRGKNNLHSQIKQQIIDKLFTFGSGANSTQRNPINREKLHFTDYVSRLLNLETAPLVKNNSICLITKLDISMQKKVSKFLSFSGLKYYRENAPEIYKDLEKKYLSEKMRFENIESQIYYIAHNIRNEKTNPVNNRKRFERRNYHPNQLQINFI